MKIDRIAQDILTATNRALEKGADIHELVRITKRGASSLRRTIAYAERQQMVFSVPSGKTQARIYFLTREAAKAYRKPAPVMKAAMPPCPKKGAQSRFKSSEAYHPKDVKTQYCPAGIDHRHTAVEPFPKVFSSLPIGVYL